MLKTTPPPTAEMHLSLGDALRTRRKELNLNLQTVADGAGLSVGFISQVERGLTAPSLSSLASIAMVLDTPISAFLDQPSGDSPATHSQTRQSYSVPVPGAELVYERLSTVFEGSRLHSVIVHEPPGHRAEPISHQGEEMFYVLEGAITIEIEGESKILAAGDSIHFDSTRTHASWNHSDRAAKVLWCGTMDIFGDAPEPLHKHPREDGATHPQTGEEDLR